MSVRPGVVGVGLIAVLLAAGGLFFGLGAASGDGESGDSIPQATRPPNTVAPPNPAVVETQPTASPVEDGVDRLPVPNVIGVSQSVAESRLADFEVVVQTVDATDADLLDEVSAQQPGAAERLVEGGTVTITISLQPVPETIPADPVPAGEFMGLNVEALADTDCANGRLVGEEFVYELVDCDQFHDMQLIETIELEGAPEEFDQLEIDELLTDQCQTAFEEFVGVKTRESTLRLLTVRPDAERYVSEGDRSSICALLPKSQVRISGSAAGALW